MNFSSIVVTKRTALTIVRRQPSGSMRTQNQTILFSWTVSLHIFQYINYHLIWYWILATISFYHFSFTDRTFAIHFILKQSRDRKLTFSTATIPINYKCTRRRNFAQSSFNWCYIVIYIITDIIVSNKIHQDCFYRYWNRSITITTSW